MLVKETRMLEKFLQQDRRGGRMNSLLVEDEGRYTALILKADPLYPTNWYIPGISLEIAVRWVRGIALFLPVEVEESERVYTHHSVVGKILIVAAAKLGQVDLDLFEATYPCSELYYSPQVNRYKFEISFSRWSDPISDLVPILEGPIPFRPYTR